MPLRHTVVALRALLFVLILHGVALSAEQPAGKGEATGSQRSSKTFAQVVQEIRDSINAGWRKLTDPKTAEPARDSVNQEWRKITDPKTVEPARQKVNEAWKRLSDAASASVGLSNKSAKDGKETKNK